jgi:hypothetical protein
MTQSQQDSVEPYTIEQILDEYFWIVTGLHPDIKAEAAAKLQQLMVEARKEQIRNDINLLTQADWSNSVKIQYLQKQLAQLTHPATEEADTTRKEA